MILNRLDKFACLFLFSDVSLFDTLLEGNQNSHMGLQRQSMGKL